MSLVLPGGWISALAAPAAMPHTRSTSAPQRLAERAAVDQLAIEINLIASGADTSPDARGRVLRAMTRAAKSVDLGRCRACDTNYGRRVLREDSTGWSLAAVTLRFGQTTEPHDHNGWGSVVVVQGVERDRRYALDGSGELHLIGERDYAAGDGYLFDRTDIHQPVGADPDRDTIALHFQFLDHSSRGLLHEHRSGSGLAIERLDAA